jgi:hypothetical protein
MDYINKYTIGPLAALTFLCTMLALSACEVQQDQPPKETTAKKSEFSTEYQGAFVTVLTDKKTGCQYIMYNGNTITRRYDPEGKVTHSCKESLGR